jgi:hypothetical protein
MMVLPRLGMDFPADEIQSARTTVRRRIGQGKQLAGLHPTGAFKLNV